MPMLARRRPTSQPPLEDLEDRIERARCALIAARGWAARTARWHEMLTLLRQRPREVVARRERERLARVGIRWSTAHALPKRGKWINGRWYPRWRLEQIGEKYRDVDLQDDDAPEGRG